MTLTLPPPIDLDALAHPIPTPGDVCALGIPGWEPFPHLMYLNERITDALATPGSRTVVEAAVRHGKTWLITAGGAAWAICLWPDDPVIVATHTQLLARRIGRMVRRLVRKFGPQFGVRISRESDSATEFALVGHPMGGFQAVSAGATPSGVGAARLFIDDPIRGPKDVATIEKRESMWEWLTETMFPRLQSLSDGSPPIVIIAMARWHEDDIVGRLFNPAHWQGEPWDRITLPAIAGENDVLGRAPGEALCPEMGYTVEYLAKVRLRSERAWAANYQQTPQVPTGRMFQPDRWGYVDVLPFGSQLVRWWDNAATKGGSGAYTAGVLLARTVDPERPWVVVDVYRERVGPSERRRDQRAKAITDQAAYGPTAMNGRVMTGAEQEPASGGKDQAEMFVTEVLEGLPATTEGTSAGSKEVRAETWAAQQGAGRVTILRHLDADGVYRPPAWVAAYVAEHTDFPLGATKDQVDASSHAFNYLALRAPKGSTGQAIASSGARRLKTGVIR